MGVGLLNEDLEELLSEVLGQLTGITTSLEHFVVKVLESGLRHFV